MAIENEELAHGNIKNEIRQRYRRRRLEKDVSMENSKAGTKEKEVPTA